MGKDVPVVKKRESGVFRREFLKTGEKLIKHGIFSFAWQILLTFTDLKI